MSWKIQICRAKPNPRGKDVTAVGSARAEQLLGEWVDLKNIGDVGVDLSVIHLAHTEYSYSCAVTDRFQRYWNGHASGRLNPLQTVRIHTGKSNTSLLMAGQDRQGTDIHAYAERSWFVLNNSCGDQLSVLWQGRNGQWYQEDTAGYDPNPPDGGVLVRVGSSLVPSAYGTYR